MNKQTTKKARNIPALITITIGIVVISLYAIFMNAFMGNPISAQRAEKQITEYIADKYPHLDLTFSRAEFNYNIPGYTVTATKSDSPELVFHITRRNDGIIVDDYQQ